MQAVPNMLELVPKGVNKGSGMRKLLANLELPVEVCHHLALLSSSFSPKYVNPYVREVRVGSTSCIPSVTRSVVAKRVLLPILGASCAA